MEFGTIREAEQAVQELNGFNMGNDVRLCVKVAERQEDRQKRLAKKREDEAFLSTLYCGKQEGSDHSCVEDYEMNDAQYISPATTSQKVNTSPGSSSEQKQLCTVCQKMTAVRCSHCRAPYCSRKCQTEDWPVHRQSCRRLDGSQNKNSVSSSSGSTGSGDRVYSDGGEKKDASLTTQHQTEKCYRCVELSLTTPQPSQTTPQLYLPTGLPEVCKVQVTDITDPWSFCVQEMDREKVTALYTLMLELQEAYRNPFQYGGFQVEVGAPCCARYDADECWYRCQVLENVGGNRVKLHYIDFGIVECISVNEVYSLDSKFTQLPSAGVLCSLNAVKPVFQTGWSSEAVQVFKSLVMGGSGDIKIITARVVSMNTAGITKVDLFIDDEYYGGQHSIAVAEILVKSEIASAAVENIYRQLEGTQLNPPTGLPEVCKVKVTDITDPWSFCVQEMDSEKLAALNTLMLELQEAYRNPFQYGGFRVQVGAPCCARYGYGGGRWYRCQVLENVGGNFVKLHYVDFGNVVCVSVDEVYSLDSKFTQLPSAGVLCSLNAVKSVFQTGWSSEDVQLFDSLVMGGSGDIKIITAQVVSKSPSGITKVDLFIDDEYSVAEILLTSASAAVENIHPQLDEYFD